MNNTISLLIGLVTAVWLLVISIFTILSFNEIKKKKIADVVIENMDFIYLRKTSNLNLKDIYLWGMSNNFANRGYAYYEPGFNINLFNIGFGVAKDIVISYNYDVNWFRDYIMDEKLTEYKMDIPRPIEVPVIENDLNIQIGMNTMCFSPPGKKYRYEYLINDISSKIVIPFDYGYIELCSMFFINENKKDDKFMNIRDRFMKVPNLEMDISYKDVYKKKYNKKYIFQLQVNSYTEEEIELWVELISE